MLLETTKEALCNRHDEIDFKLEHMWHVLRYHTKLETLVVVVSTTSSLSHRMHAFVLSHVFSRMCGRHVAQLHG